MTPAIRRRLLIVAPGLLGAIGAGSLMDSLHVDGWAITMAALLGGVLAGAQAWLLLGQRADRRMQTAERRDTLAQLTKLIETRLPTRRELETLEGRLRNATAEDEAQMEAYAQLMLLVP